MRAFLLRAIAALAISSTLVASLSCARDQQLEFIEVLPQNVSLAGTPTIIYTALGHYIHPPVVKDITTKVLWQTDAPSIIAFTDPSHPNYLVPTGLGCGTNLGVLAFVYRNPSDPSSGRAVVGTSTVNVQCGNAAGADFGLSANPLSATVAHGSGTSYTINVTALAGSPVVALQVTGGVPSGASASLSPTSVTGTGSSTLTVTTSGSTAPGTYHLLITGSDSTSALSISVDLVVT